MREPRQTVGGLVEGAVTCEHCDDVDTALGGSAREIAGVQAGLRPGHDDVVMLAEHGGNTRLDVRRHRGRRRIDDQRDPHGGAPYPSTPYL